MKHSLFWAAVEAAAKATRSGLSVVGALVDCGIPRQHAGAQWLTEKEAEEEVAEPAKRFFCDNCGTALGESAATNRFGSGMYCSSRCVREDEASEVPPMSADFNDEPCPHDDVRFAEPPNLWLCQQCHAVAPLEDTMRSIRRRYQDSRTNAGATCNRAVEETSEGASPPAAPSDVLEGDRFMTDAEFHAALAVEKRRWVGLAERLKASDGPVANPNISTITDVLAEHYLETYSDRKIVGCRCGLEVGSRQQHWDHQADLISGALKARAQAAEK